MTTRSRYPSCASARKIRAAVSSSSAGKEDAYADHARAAVGPNHRAQLATIDRHLRVPSTKLGLDLGCVSGRVPVDDPDPLDRSLGDDQLDKPPQRAAHRP